jgi:magnesium chelatase family protein
VRSARHELGHGQLGDIDGITGHVLPVAAEPAMDAAAASRSSAGLPQPGATRDRVHAAITNSGLPLAPHRVTISLPRLTYPSPDSSLDLAMAAAILSTGGAIAPTALDAVVLVGELDLDGSVRPVRGVLPMVAIATA